MPASGALDSVAGNGRVAGKDDGVAKLPAHRPSRRDKIVDAAVATFARRGFVDTSIADVADVAGVAPAAVYYHFAGKEDLYGAAVGLVLDDIDRVVAVVRPDDAPAGHDTLSRVIDAVWDWVDEHPERAQLVYLHTPAATRQAADRRQDFDDLHVRRAFGYAGSTDGVSAARRGTATVAMRTLVDALIAIHQMRMPGGPLSTYPTSELRAAAKAMSTRIVLAV